MIIISHLELNLGLFHISFYLFTNSLEIVRSYRFPFNNKPINNPSVGSNQLKITCYWSPNQREIPSGKEKEISPRHFISTSDWPF